jgi:hypothetical protein
VQPIVCFSATKYYLLHRIAIPLMHVLRLLSVSVACTRAFHHVPVIREMAVQKALALRENGHIEYTTAAGRADVVTIDEIIEVKHLKQWKAGLGQVIAYSYCCPDKGARLHLFAHTADAVKARETLPLVQSICDSVRVRLTFELC